MEFFNKKEEVIDIQLTQYGKYLLSQGKFRPAYYSFSDEGVVYDSDYGIGAEAQNDAEPRIQENTPSLKVQHNFLSMEKQARKISPDEMYALENMPGEQASRERNQCMTTPLANSSLGSDKFPAWKISSLSGEFLTGSITATITSSVTAEVLEIPQIEARVKYDVTPEAFGEIWNESFVTEVMTGQADGIPPELLEALINPDTENITFETMTFPDGSSYVFNKDDLILQIVEDNAPLGNENFEIEVFTVEDVVEDEQTTENLTPLYFIKEPILIVNDILLDEPEQKEQETNEQFVEFYFDLEVDDEIDALLICRKLQDADKEEYKYARQDFVCPDTEPNYQYVSPYSQKETDTDTGCGE